MVLEWGVQQPYIPVCLMTSITAGTSYYRELDYFRGFRDQVLLEKGILGRMTVKAYYHGSRLLCGLCERFPPLKTILLNLWFKPLLKLTKRVYK